MLKRDPIVAVFFRILYSPRATFILGKDSFDLSPMLLSILYIYFAIYFSL